MRCENVGLGPHARFNEVLHALSNDASGVLLIDDVHTRRPGPLYLQVSEDVAPRLLELGAPPAPSSERGDGSAVPVHQDGLEQT
jgi:hypothetical protein